MATADSQLTRRRFFQLSTAVGGSLLLSVAIPARSRPGSSGPSVLNAYVRVDANGRVTVVMPKVEMGEGTYTSLPMLVAEEMDVDLSSIDIEAAPPNPAVYGFDGDQSTGGSTTIRLCYLPMRKAGAAARAMLIEAAAKKWGVSPATCRAELGNVIHDASGRKSGYGELAAAAAAIAVPADPPLKAAKDFRLIGRSTPRRDSLDKTTGRAIFGIDVRLSGLRVAMVAMSPVQGGAVVEPLRTEAALAIQGVRQVVNERDLVAVVADDTWAAMKGMKALEPQWGGGPNAAVQQGQLVSDLETAVRRPGAVAAHVGDARGVGPTRSVFVVESFMDELAAAAKQDPVAYRRALLKDARMKAVLDLAVQKSGWGNPLPAGHGRGISVQFAFGSYMTQVTEVSVGKGGKLRVERVVCALDCGQVVNPDTVHAQLQGGVMFGLSAALFNEITFAGGRVQQSNFDNFRSMRITEAPRVETYLVDSRETPGGVGETGTACAAAALCNAIFAATGKRIRTLPVSRSLPV